MDIKSLVSHALQVRELSRSELVKVGCVIQDVQGVMFTGHNGNGYLGKKLEDKDQRTMPGVIHAEADAIAYAAKHGNPLEGATMVVTLAPCINCAALIVNSGIKQLCYIDPWWDVAALDMLKQHKINITRIRINKKKP